MKLAVSMSVARCSGEVEDVESPEVGDQQEDVPNEEPRYQVMLAPHYHQTIVLHHTNRLEGEGVRGWKGEREREWESEGGGSERVRGESGGTSRYE